VPTASSEHRHGRRPGGTIRPAPLLIGINIRRGPGRVPFRDGIPGVNFKNLG
jgi:hypothetical protein